MCVGVALADMTEEEREKFARNLTGHAREAYEERKREGWYNQDHRRDRCKEAREQKEREERDKEARVEAIQQRNIVLEQVARQQEVDIRKAQADITKLASLVAQLMPK